MAYYYRWEDFPEKEISYLKGSPDASKLLITILSTANMMLSKINAKKDSLSKASEEEKAKALESEKAGNEARIAAATPPVEEVTEEVEASNEEE